MKNIGVLALQGDFQKHIQMFTTLGVNAIQVKTVDQLDSCSGLVVPGGESTTLTKLLKKHEMWQPLIEFSKSGVLFGTCAGLIILSSAVTDNSIEPLNLIDLTVERNAYGRQIDSFIDDIDTSIDDTTKKFEAVFIRAPKIKSIGKTVRAIGWHQDDVVLAENDSILVATFHPELTNDTSIHKHFLNKIGF